MAKLRFKGLDEYVHKLNQLADPRRVNGMIKASVYPGAGIVADAIRERLETHDRTGDLAKSLTLTEMEDDNGYIFTQVGFAGYDANGVPNALKAAALESGTSRNGREHQPKTPFIRPALNAVRKKAEAAMAAELDSRINQLMED